MRALLFAVDLLLTIYIWILLAHMVLYWLIEFRVLDRRGRLVATAHRWLSLLALPALWPVRLVLPELGGVDSSPLAAIMLLLTARYVIAIYILPRFLS